MGDAWLQMSAAALGCKIGDGEIDPVELTEVFLEAIEKHELSPRIYARATPERARAEAVAARSRAMQGRRCSPLDGVPISWKDLFDTAGIATEAGSALLRDRIPDRDALVLRNATAAGMICLGKTHMTELAFSGLGLNPITETPPCINDREAVAGGSSSGAATSVAFGLAAAAIGSDTGGSVRVPSVWNDLVGLKTSAGRLPLDGVVPLAARFDTVGPLCRTVEDAAQIFAALEGGRRADLRGATLGGSRLMVLTTTAFDALEEAPARGMERALSVLGSAGARIEEREIPEIAAALSLSGILFASEAYGTWKDAIEANPDAMFPAVRDRFRGGKTHTAADYVAAWQALDRHRGAYARATSEFDAVLIPTCPILPPKIADLEADTDYFAERNLLALRNTRIGNLMGLAALTIPTGIPSAGLSLLGPARSEERLLRLGAAIQRALA